MTEVNDCGQRCYLVTNVTLKNESWLVYHQVFCCIFKEWGGHNEEKIGFYWLREYGFTDGY